MVCKPGRNLSALKIYVFSTAIPMMIVTTLIGSSFCAGNCSEGWFGDSCQFQCHCLGEGDCDTDGTCPGRCTLGFFGPACQYYTSHYSSDKASELDLTWLTDSDDRTCNPQGTQSVTVALNRSQPFTWLRVVVSDADKLDKLVLGYRIENDPTRQIACNDAETSLVSDRVLDIWCPTKLRISHVTLDGPSVGKLCSLYISVGRNVALKQKTQSSDIDQEWYSENAVDGSIDGEAIAPEKTCFKTRPQRLGGEPPFWSVQFRQLVNVTRFDIINSKDTCCEEDPMGYTLWAYFESHLGLKPYYSQDRDPPPIRQYTVIPSPRIDGAVNKVTFQRLGYRLFESLTLCEVRIYGESACPPKTFGRQCESECNCADQKTCFVSTGGCPSGCAPGYTGEDCWKPCEDNKYGVGCTNTCSEHCRGGKCSSINGSCGLGCDPGYKQPLCTEACDVGKYGPGCGDSCNVHCAGLNNTCNNVDGSCDHGCEPGYHGALCEEVCDSGMHGPGCREVCSVHCAGGNATCSVLDGSCRHGCMPGFQAPFCNKAATSSNDKLLSIIMAVGVVVIAIALVAIAVIVWRRCRGRTSIPLDDNTTAGQVAESPVTGVAVEPHRRETQQSSRDAATSTQAFSNYDVMRYVSQDDDARHIYANDFDPYDRVMERIYSNGVSGPAPTVDVATTSNGAAGRGRGVDGGNDDNDVDDGNDTAAYIQMVDVRSPVSILNGDTESVADGANRGEIDEHDGEYLNPIGDIGAGLDISPYVKMS